MDQDRDDEVGGIFKGRDLENRSNRCRGYEW